MIAKRALYVLDEISSGVSAIESECERLALLIVEAREREYWKLRYQSEQQWILSTFHSTSSFRHLASMGDAYKNQPGVITELGRHRAEILVRVARKEEGLSQEWIDKAKSMTCDHLRAYVNDRHPSRLAYKTEERALQAEIEKAETRLHFHERQIEFLKNRIEKLRVKLSQVAA